MNTHAIEHALRHIPRFGGVLAKDELVLEYGKSSKFYVVNTDPSHLPGEHWVAFYTGARPEFFDSTAHSPRSYGNGFNQFLVHYGPQYMYNCERIQAYGSQSCGLYCIYYVYMRSLGFSMFDVVNTFCNHLDANEAFIQDFYVKFLRRVN